MTRHQSMLVACATLCAINTASAQPIELADGIVMIPGQVNSAPYRGPDGNTVMFRAPDGWIVFDTGRYATHTAKALDHAQASGEGIAAIVNSHWHTDHIGGNPRIRAVHPDVQVYASGALEVALRGFIPRSIAGARQRLAQLGDGDVEQRRAIEHDLAIIENPDALRPDVVVSESGAMSIAGRRFDVRLSRAASGGDVWLIDAANSLVVTGDLVTLPAPFLDTACPTRWAAALDELMAVPFKTAVPGHGPALERDEVERYRGMAHALIACAATERTAQACGAEWIEAAGTLIPEADRAYAVAAMNYYVGLLRDEASVARICAGEVG